MKYGWKALGFENYVDYLQSYLWKDKRDFFLKLKPICEKCGSKATQAHHKNYENVGNEGQRDLMALCSDCHKKIHKGEEND